MSAPAPVSFTIRRPSPVSRADSEASDSDSSSFRIPALPRHLTTNSSAPGSPLARSEPTTPYADSSDEDDELQDELVTGFDKFGVQRLHEKKKAPQGPLVIPALKNRDWRELARKRKGASQFVPDSGRAPTGADGSVGGLGTKDSINSGPQLSGLQKKKKKFAAVKQEEDDGKEDHDGDLTMKTSDSIKEEEETEDQKARKAILAAITGNGYDVHDGPIVDIIQVSEQDAYLQDVQELPEVSTIEDYARVPVSQFGAALLRGMGWKEGTAASRKVGKDGKAKGPIDPYLPEARPAFLGIGAKERIIEDDGSTKKNRRPEKRYVPVVKKELVREGGTGSRSEDHSSRKYSSRRDRSSERDRDRSSRRQSPDSRVRSRRSSRSRSPRRDRDRDRDRDYDDGRRDKKDKDRRERDYDRDSKRRRDYEYEYGREKSKALSSERRDR